jgi:uncharacterized membrane protein YccC
MAASTSILRVPASWEPFFTPSALAFSLRTFAASMLALGLAFWLQFDDADWAPVTVWLVANSAPGATFVKGLHRFGGTIVGGVMGVTLVALFPQSPVLFFIALGIWMAVCTIVSSLQRSFASYSAAVAGYGTSIISLSALDSPNDVFTIATARVSCILLAVACVYIVSALFAPHRARGKAMKAFRDVLSSTARAIGGVSTIDERKKNIADLVAAEPLIELAEAEDTDFRLHRASAESLLGHLFTAMAAHDAMLARLERTNWPSESLEAIYQNALTLLPTLSETLEQKEEAAFITKIGELRQALQNVPEPPAGDSLVTYRLLLDRMDEMLEQLKGAVGDWLALQGRAIAKETLKLNFHQDYRLALINGLRTFVAVEAVSAFSVATNWTDATAAVIRVCVMCSLYATLPRPDLTSRRYFKFSLVAVACAFLQGGFILPNVSGFPLLVLSLALVFVPLGLLFATPTTATIPPGFSIVFFATLSPTNQMNYDIQSLLNDGFATVIGVVAATLAYTLVFPPNPAAARRYAAYRMRLGLEIVSTKEPAPSQVSWASRMYDRINRLIDPKNPSGTATNEVLRSGLSALHVGQEIIRLRQLPVAGESKAILKDVLDIFQYMVAHPDRVLDAVSRSLQKLRATSLPSTNLPQLRAVGALEEMESELRGRAAFFLIRKAV